MSYLIGTLAALVTIAASANAPEIKATTRLTVIASAGLVEITEPEVLAQSHVFAGNFIGSPAESPDPAFARHTVIFDIQTQRGIKHGAYAVHLVFDDATGAAFVYLPGRGEPAYRSNASTMIRDGQDGRWHHASTEWAAAIHARLR